MCCAGAPCSCNLSRRKKVKSLGKPKAANGNKTLDDGPVAATTIERARGQTVLCHRWCLRGGLIEFCTPIGATGSSGPSEIEEASGQGGSGLCVRAGQARLMSAAPPLFVAGHSRVVCHLGHGDAAKSRSSAPACAAHHHHRVRPRVLVGGPARRRESMGDRLACCAAVWTMGDVSDISWIGIVGGAASRSWCQTQWRSLSCRPGSHLKLTHCDRAAASSSDAAISGHHSGKLEKFSRPTSKTGLNLSTKCSPPIQPVGTY